ncbi:hypothetical protein DPMN_106294 [Dreissena polymorpha]|uniref:Uncharacterized protein n=1 Tax=Dreissena polymorpha TaxID=45954 RepID=A0A9D4QIC7_DREPO|nr:hypothetical protein DPMN_106294 [Dreissena polymorpha]
MKMPEVHEIGTSDPNKFLIQSIFKDELLCVTIASDGMIAVVTLANGDTRKALNILQV